MMCGGPRRASKGNGTVARTIDGEGPVNIMILSLPSKQGASRMIHLWLFWDLEFEGGWIGFPAHRAYI